MRSTLSLFSMLALSLLASAGPARADVVACGAPSAVTLVAGQHYTSGGVTIFNDATQLYVRFDAAAGWQIEETHVAVAATLAGIPQTKKGNPIPGQFEYSSTYSPAVGTALVTIPLASLNLAPGSQVVVAAHAVVRQLASGRTETAWAQGPGFPGANWAMYTSFTVQSCCTDPRLPQSPVGITLSWDPEFAALSQVPAGFDIANGSYKAWCASRTQYFYPGFTYGARLYSTYSPSMPVASPNWDLINYVINHDAGVPSHWDVQQAIWYFLGGQNDNPLSAAAQALIADAIAHGEGFIPVPGQKLAVFALLESGAQPTLVELTCPLK